MYYMSMGTACILEVTQFQGRYRGINIHLLKTDKMKHIAGAKH